MRAALLAGVVLCTLATPALAQDAAPGLLDRLDWAHMLGKAATFEVLSSLLETGIYVGFFGGTAATAGGVFAISLTTAAATYVAHEIAWEAATRPGEDRTDPGRVAAKTVTYRIVSLGRSLVQGSVLAGASTAGSALYAVTVSVADSALYAASETLMERLRLRERPAPVEPAPPAVAPPRIRMTQVAWPQLGWPALRLPWGAGPMAAPEPVPADDAARGGQAAAR